MLTCPRCEPLAREQTGGSAGTSGASWAHCRTSSPRGGHASPRCAMPGRPRQPRKVKPDGHRLGRRPRTSSQSPQHRVHQLPHGCRRHPHDTQPCVVHHPPKLREHHNPQSLRPCLPQLRRKPHRLQQFQQIQRQHLQPQPSCVRPELPARLHSGRQCVLPHPVDVCHRARLAPLPLQQGAPVPLPVVAHDRAVLHGGAVANQAPLGLAYPNRHVAIRRRVLAFHRPARDGGAVGPLPHHPAALLRPWRPGALRQRSDCRPHLGTPFRAHRARPAPCLPVIAAVVRIGGAVRLHPDRPAVCPRRAGGGTRLSHHQQKVESTRSLRSPSSSPRLRDRPSCHSPPSEVQRRRRKSDHPHNTTLAGSTDSRYGHSTVTPNGFEGSRETVYRAQLCVLLNLR
jgi:hypothetical protein